MTDKKTDYFDNSLQQNASVMYQAELAASQHYESLRAGLTAANFTIVGVFIGLDAGKEYSVAFLVLLSAVAGLLSMRLSHAHWFHFHYAAKMRGILARRHPKLDEKLQNVRDNWSKDTIFFSWLEHSWLWNLINFGAPLLVALFLSTLFRT